MNRRAFLVAGAAASLAAGASSRLRAAAAAAGQAGSTLYNGIRLPAPWPPKLTDPPELTDPPDSSGPGMGTAHPQQCGGGPNRST